MCVCVRKRESDRERERESEFFSAKFRFECIGFYSAGYGGGCYLLRSLMLCYVCACVAACH